MTDLSEARLREIEALCNAATPGPWQASVGGIDQLVPHKTVPDAPWDVYPESKTIVGEWGDDEHRGFAYEADAEFSAAARTDCPDLVAEVRRLRWDLASYQGQLSTEYRKRVALEEDVRRLREELAEFRALAAEAADIVPDLDDETHRDTIRRCNDRGLSELWKDVAGLTLRLAAHHRP